MENQEFTNTPEKDKFIDKLENHLQKHKKASCLAGHGSFVFIDKMFALFAEEKPTNIGKWLENRMKDRFLYATEPPKWTRRCEKSWLYFQGEPMVFLCQFSLGTAEAKQMNGQFPVGETYYVFGTKQQIDGNSWKSVIKMIAQDPSDGSHVRVDYLSE